MSIEKNFHGLPCNCYSRLVLLGILPDPNASTCPTLCGAGFNILEISDNYTVDGYYLQVDASNIVYMESGIITETIPCESGFADFHQSSGNTVAAVAVWHNNTWDVLITVTLASQDFGIDFQLETIIGDWFTNPCTGVCQISEDGGVTWTQVGTMTNAELIAGSAVTFPTTAENYIYRTIITDTVTGCSYYNPSPDIGTAAYCIDYVVIDSAQTGGAAFDLLGTINGVTPLDDLRVFQPLIMATLAEPYQSVSGAYGGLGFQEGSGISGGFYMQVLRPSTAATTASIATILDAGGTPIDATPTGTNCEAKTYYGSFTPVDFTQLFVDGLILAGTQISFPEVQTPALNDQSEFLSRMEERGLRDPAMAVVFTGVAPLDYSVTIRTALPIESVVFDEVGVGQIIVNLTEI